VSIRKYDMAKEYKAGIAARLTMRPCEWDKCSEAFMAGYTLASESLADTVHVALNGYLLSIGEEECGMVQLTTPTGESE